MRPLVALISVLLAFVPAAQAGSQTPAERAGASIYRNGMLPSGQPLSAKREPNLQISGAEAACANCHKRSGLGEMDGSLKIPPISGAYLFRPRTPDRGGPDVPFLEGMGMDRDPYTAATLARAIREGSAVDGKPLSILMPRYSMSDVDMAVLIDYLKILTPSRVRGVSGAVVNFATIVTPDADPVKRQAMLNVLAQYFTDQNAFALGASPSIGQVTAVKSNAKRRWQLHVWDLTGPPSSWDAELRQHLADQPVYAVISGLGGKDWSPVHRFCENLSLPCIFPNVDLPVVAEHDFYPLYFSRGVLLESDLLARELSADHTAARRVVQVFRADDIGAAAAVALHDTLAGSGMHTTELPLSTTGDARQLAAVLQKVRPEDALVLWLRTADIESLAKIPVRSFHVLLSGLMAGLDGAPLPPAWRAVTRMAYPVDLPDKRTIRVDYAMGWLADHRIPVVAETVQVATYVACSLTLQTLTHMSGSFVPDYLVERMEGMLEHQLISGYFPRLALAPNERFASKGGYLVHFADPSGMRILPDGEWVVP